MRPEDTQATESDFQKAQDTLQSDIDDWITNTSDSAIVGAFTGTRYRRALSMPATLFRGVACNIVLADSKSLTICCSTGRVGRSSDSAPELTDNVWENQVVDLTSRTHCVSYRSCLASLIADMHTHCTLRLVCRCGTR